MKTCTKCHGTKPRSDFFKDARKRDGLQSRCKPCNTIANRECRAKKIDKYRQKDRERYWRLREELTKYQRDRRAGALNRRYNLKSKYGITPEQYDAMLLAQGGVCGICQKPPPRKGLGVDHCHETLVIRGLLCDACNSALGTFGDNVVGVQRALDYVSGGRSS